MSHSNNFCDRRSFLFLSSAFSMTAALPSSLIAQVTSDADPSHRIPTRDTILKFNSDGSRRAFAGNTVICHLPQQTHVHDAIAALGDALRTSPFSTKLGMLPSESYHMTIFPGANDQGRTPDGWPSDIPFNASIQDCNRIIGERMKQFRLECALPLRVVVDVPRTLNYGWACSLRMSPADKEESTKLRVIRDRRSDVYRFRTKDHASYEFHITLAYQMASFTSQQQAQYQTLLEKHLPVIAAAKPVIELGIPEFCTFDDMYRFEIQTLLHS